MSKEPKPGTGTVLTILNRQVESCGKPPNIKPHPSHYIGYFENRHGEQLVFLFNQDTNRGKLWHGDYSWDTPVEVRGPIPTAHGIILSEEEQQWLTLCWWGNRHV